MRQGGATTLLRSLRQRICTASHTLGGVGFHAGCSIMAGASTGIPARVSPSGG